jgi:hypothetical protein
MKTRINKTEIYESCYKIALKHFNKFDAAAHAMEMALNARAEACRPAQDKRIALEAMRRG